MGKNDTRAARRAAELTARKEAEKKAKTRARAQQERLDERSSRESIAAGVLPRWLPWLACALTTLVLLVAIGFNGLVYPALPIAGDQVTHNWWLLEFRDRLLAGNLPFGWTNDLSNGFPFGYFYFPLPPIVFSLLSIVFSDALAVKTMVALSLVIIPIGAWRFASGLRLGPAASTLAPIVVLAAVFSNQPQFVGGTFYSTLTGEFSYAYGLGFGLAALGSLARLLRREGNAMCTATLFAAAVLSHIQASIIPVVFAAAMVVHALYRKQISAHVVYLTAAATAGFTAWWILPVLQMRTEALGDGHARVTDVFGWVFNLETLPVVVAGVASLVYAVIRKAPAARLVAALAGSGLVIMIAMPGSFLWNIRSMPWTYTMLAIATVYSLEPALHALIKKGRKMLPLVLLAPLAVALAVPMTISENRGLATTIGESQYGGRGFPATKYLEDLTEFLLTQQPGRVMLAVPEMWAGAMPARDWVTSLPMLTDGKFSSPISLFYEASKSTPAIEYTHSYVSEQAHTSLSWLAYQTPEEFATGVEAMRLMGVRYYIVGDQEMYNRAAALPEKLKQIGLVGAESKAPAEQWAVFEVFGAEPLVTAVPGTIEVPVEIPGSVKERGSADVNWLDEKIKDPGYPVVVDSGAELFRAAAGGPVNISAIEITDSKISFDVDNVNVPVLVKVSHSTLWKASGAHGPFRATPNFMVVLPTAQHVELHIATPASVPVGFVISVLSILGALGFSLLRRIRHRTGKQS
jgi:hypothetical protein